MASTRGLPRKVYSDNALQFKRANKEIMETGKSRIRIQEVGGAGREVWEGASRKMLGQPQDNRQFVVTPGSGNRVHGSRHTLVPVVGFSRSRGESSILQEEGLVPRKSMFEEVRLPSLILTSQAALMEDGVEFTFCLGGDVIVQVFVPVGDVLP